MFSISSIQTDINNKNSIHNNKFRQNKGTSKVPNHTINLDNKYKSPTHNDGIKKVKTLLEAKNLNNNKLKEILNDKDLKIRFMRTNNNIRHIFKNKQAKQI